MKSVNEGLAAAARRAFYIPKLAFWVFKIYELRPTF